MTIRYHISTFFIWLGEKFFKEMGYDDTGVPKTKKSGQYQLNIDVLGNLAVKYPYSVTFCNIAMLPR